MIETERQAGGYGGLQNAARSVGGAMMHVGSAGTQDRVSEAAPEERTSMIRVLVVSENRLHGEGLTLRLSAEPDIRAIGPRESITETLPLVDAGEVDMVLVDVEPTAAHLRELGAAVRVAEHVPYVA